MADKYVPGHMRDPVANPHGKEAALMSAYEALIAMVMVLHIIVDLLIALHEKK